jgi:hypothetical protein
MKGMRGVIAGLLLFGGLSMPAVAHAVPGNAPEAGTACALVRATRARPTGYLLSALARELQLKYPRITDAEAANLTTLLSIRCMTTPPSCARRTETDEPHQQAPTTPMSVWAKSFPLKRRG